MRVEKIAIAGYDEVYRLEDPDGFVALHRCRIGPAHGGTRIKDYASPEDALADALRLGEAMTRKCAINEIPAGGGKAVLMRNSIRDRRAALSDLGDFVESLRGRFFTGSDLGTTPEDIEILKSRTRYVACQDLSEHAAQGVLFAIHGALQCLYGRPESWGRTIIVQGLGAVGYKLADKLVSDGARVVATDVDSARLRQAEQELSIETVPPESVLATSGDVLAPCAVGGVIHRGVLSELRCAIVCGAANNILDSDATAQPLHDAGIVFVPDFLANSGATIQGVLTNLKGPGDYTAQIRAIKDRTVRLLQVARETRRPPLDVALEWIRC